MLQAKTWDAWDAPQKIMYLSATNLQLSAWNDEEENLKWLSEAI
jgi:hypothetical protein